MKLIVNLNNPEKKYFSTRHNVGFLSFNAGCFDNLTEYAKDYGRIARLIKVDSESLRQSGLNLIRAVKKFNVKLGMPSDIRSMGISKEEFKAQLDKMAKNAAGDRCSLTNPRDADTDDIKRASASAIKAD